jgi:hypothetical protein
MQFNPKVRLILSIIIWVTLICFIPTLLRALGFDFQTRYLLMHFIIGTLGLIWFGIKYKKSKL